MTRTLLLFAVIALASLPLIPAWFYFRTKNIKGLWFLVCAGTGLVSVLIALIAQSFIPAFINSGMGYLFYVFIRIALLEELSRLIVLLPVLGFASHSMNNSENPEIWGGTAGFIAGFGFAAAESAFYAAADPGIALLRAFSAAPLHGACGARLGSASACVRRRPLRALFFFLMAVLIHGMYDFFILDTVLPSILSLFIALAALGSSLLAIRRGDDEQ